MTEKEIWMRPPIGFGKPSTHHLKMQPAISTSDQSWHAKENSQKLSAAIDVPQAASITASTRHISI